MSRDAPATQICNPTAQNTQKPTPTKEVAFGCLHKGGAGAFGTRPFVVSFVGVGFCVFWAVGLHICVVGASLDTIAPPAEQTNSLCKSLYECAAQIRKDFENRHLENLD